MADDDKAPQKAQFSPVRGPLGIIGSFITLIYGLAVTAVGLARASEADTTPLIWFVVLFPVLVLWVFTWLLVRHTDKLYSPSEFGEHRPSCMNPVAPETANQIPKKRRAPRPRRTAAAPEPGASEESKP